MSKGSNRRPQYITNKELDNRWDKAFRRRNMKESTKDTLIKWAILLFLFLFWFLFISWLTGCSSTYTKTDPVVVPDYTKYQAYPVYIIQRPGSYTIYNTRPVLEPYYGIPLQPPPVTIYVY